MIDWWFYMFVYIPLELIWNIFMHVRPWKFHAILKLTEFTWFLFILIFSCNFSDSRWNRNRYCSTGNCEDLLQKINKFMGTDLHSFVFSWHLLPETKFLERTLHLLRGVDFILNLIGFNVYRYISSVNIHLYTGCSSDLDIEKLLAGLRNQ